MPAYGGREISTGGGCEISAGADVKYVPAANVRADEVPQTREKPRNHRARDRGSTGDLPWNQHE